MKIISLGPKFLKILSLKLLKIYMAQINGIEIECDQENLLFTYELLKDINNNLIKTNVICKITLETVYLIPFLNKSIDYTIKLSNNNGYISSKFLPSNGELTSFCLKNIPGKFSSVSINSPMYFDKNNQKIIFQEQITEPFLIFFETHFFPCILTSIEQKNNKIFLSFHHKFVL